MTTLWVSVASKSLNAPVNVAVPFSLIGDPTERLVKTGLKSKLFVRKYSPVVPPSFLTRTLYVAPGVSPVTTRDSLRPSAMATPLPSRIVPVLSYSSIPGLSVLTGSPGPSPGVLVSNRTAFAAPGNVIEYQSLRTVRKTSWTVPGATVVPPNINCVAVPVSVVIAPPKEIVDPIAAFNAATAAELSVIATVVLLSAGETTRVP